MSEECGRKNKSHGANCETQKRVQNMFVQIKRVAIYSAFRRAKIGAVNFRHQFVRLVNGDGGNRDDAENNDKKNCRGQNFVDFREQFFGKIFRNKFYRNLILKFARG